MPPGARVRLDHRHMFERCGVEHIWRPKAFEDRAHRLCLPDRTERLVEGDAGELLARVELDRIEAVLGVIEEHDFRRREARDLLDQLGPDRAAGPGYENPADRKSTRLNSSH